MYYKIYKKLSIMLSHTTFIFIVTFEITFCRKVFILRMLIIATIYYKHDSKYNHKN